MATPMWTFAGTPVEHDMSTWTGSVSYRAQLMSSHIPESSQVIEASSSWYLAEVIEMSSEKCFAFPTVSYQDGDDLLSDVQDDVIDSGSTLTLTGTPLNCRNCEPVTMSIQLAKKGQTMNAEYECIKTLLEKSVRYIAES